MDNNNTILDVINDACKQYREQAAFTCLGHTLSYSDIARLSDCFANYLINHTTLQPGDRIAIQLPNLLQYPVAMFGALKAGLIVVNTNPLYTSRELAHQLQDSGAKALVVLANIADTAASVVAETDVETVIVTEVADLLRFPAKQVINFAARYIKKMVPDFTFAASVSFSSAMKLGGASVNHQDLATIAKQTALDDTAILQYTGGTTGVAKGAMLTHNNIVCNMLQVRQSIGEYVRSSVEIYAAPLPLYHVYAFTLHCMVLFNTGNHSILIPNPRDIESLVKAIKPWRLTGFIGLNTLFTHLARNSHFRALDWSSLRATCSGGMALTRDAAELWQDVTGVQVCEGYGLTETSPVVSCNPPSAIRQGTIGKPVVATECKVIDANGNTLANGEAGELCVRGPQVMKGYWQRPEATADIIDRDGWLKTGDVAVIEDDGYMRIVDRIKDMIIVSGFNVYPNEVEDIVVSHPKVLEAAVIGVPDPESGEVIKLFVVKSDESLTKVELQQFCREQLTGYKRPRNITFVDELPKSNVGKVLRKELRDRETS